MSRWHTRAVAFSSLALAGLLLTACGVPTSAVPTTIPPSNIPEGLVANAPPDRSPHFPTGGLKAEPVDVFLFKGSLLEPVVREVALPHPADSFATVREALVALDYPSPAELEAGYRSYVPYGTGLVVNEVDKSGIATVTLGSDFFTLVGPYAANADAQIVFTATAVPGVTAVLFEEGGTPIYAEAPNGHLIVAPATRADYASLAGS
jgi:hypothetical protein